MYVHWHVMESPRWRHFRRHVYRSYFRLVNPETRLTFNQEHILNQDAEPMSASRSSTFVLLICYKRSAECASLLVETFDSTLEHGTRYSVAFYEQFVSDCCQHSACTPWLHLASFSAAELTMRCSCWLSSHCQPQLNRHCTHWIELALNQSTNI